MGVGGDEPDLIPVEPGHRVARPGPLGVDLLPQRLGDLHGDPGVAQQTCRDVGVVGLLVVDPDEEHRGLAPAPDATVLRYLGAFGPASVKDMQTWSGLTRLGPVFAGLRHQLAVFRDENGVELFDLPDASRPDEDTPAPPRFLPEFDNLLLSHADRARVVPPQHKGRAWSGNQAHRTLLVDGFLAGIWRIEERKDGSALLTVQLFESLSTARRAEVTEEAARLLADMTAATSYDVRFGEFAGGQG
ncbi:winged helix DNA-binding domain-containing protein [Streptomyces hundungensis]